VLIEISIVEQEISMTKYVLLFEPFEMLAATLVLSMEELGFKVDIGNSAGDGDELLGPRKYECVFINLDQNRKDWHSHWLMLANKASQLALSVVMIPDNPMAQDVIRKKGWLQIKKPFNLDELKDVMERATWERDALAGSA
jgi:DNA-binding NtrC family response regulator